MGSDDPPADDAQLDDAQLFDLTRRKVLGGMSAVGLAAVGAGLGTTAYFSDEETYRDNRLVAGSLDLKVDWEEHYSDWSDDEAAGLEYPVLMAAPTDSEIDYVGLPDPAAPLLWVAETDLPRFMDNTALEAFPDPNNDGVQETRLPGANGDGFTYDACAMGADTPEHLDPSGDGLRTMNQDTWDAAAEEPRPLVALDDVKPGDFGELTLSFHLCDNPGYVWLEGELVAAAENGRTEPEREDPDEGEGVELLDEIRTAWWYDSNGDNVVSEQIGTADVMLCVDTSGSFDDADQLATDAENLAGQLTAQGDVQIGGLSFGGGSIDDFQGLGSFSSFPPLSNSGNTPMPQALEIAAAELDANGRAGAESVIVLFTDGGPNYANATYTAGGHTVSGYSGGDPNSRVDNSELCETATIAASIRQHHRIITVGIDDDGLPTNNNDPSVCGTANPIPSLSAYLRDYIAGSSADYFQAEAPDAVSDVLSDIVEAISSLEEVFHRGTLRSDLQLLADGGVPLDGDLTTAFAEGSDDPTERECFEPGVTHYVGMAWWLPVDHANEIQTDSVTFDLGFYTEQCRHNDGSGIPSCEVVTGDGWGKQQTFQQGIESAFARGRFGDNLATGAWEVALGEPGSPTPTIHDEANYVWTDGATVPFSYSYDGATATFELDGTVVSGAVPTPNGKVGLQLKADEASIAVDSLQLQDASGGTVASGQSLAASNDGAGRQLRYLVYGEECFDAAAGFTLSGDVTVSIQGDYSGADEDVAFDVIVE